MEKIVQRKYKSGGNLALPLVSSLLIGAMSWHIVADYKEDKRHEALIEKSIRQNHELYKSNKDLQQKVDTLETELEESEDEMFMMKKSIKAMEKELAKIEAEKLAKAKVVAEAKEIEGKTYHVTHYVATCKGCSGITKTGVDVRNTIYYKGYRIIAVDPNLIPLGSIVEMSDGKTTFKAIAIDVGGGIKSNEVDLLVGSVSEAMKQGKKDYKVKIIRKGW
jgi:3D (Asp-Asp-Asp) domain-containing protein